MTAMPRGGPIPTQAKNPRWASRRWRFGVLLLGLSFALVIGVGLYADWICTDATYSCPANGCGNVPAQNCHEVLTGPLFIAAVTGAGLALVGGTMAGLRDRSPGFAPPV